MSQKSSKPPIPYPSIDESDKSYYFSEVVKWIFNNRTKANKSDRDMVRVYRSSGAKYFYPNEQDRIEEFEFDFSVISHIFLQIHLKLKDKQSCIIQTSDFLPNYDKSISPSCHSKLVYSILGLLKHNAHDFIVEVSKNRQVDNIIRQESYRGELHVLSFLIDELHIQLEDSEFQLIPNLYYHPKNTKTYPLKNYNPPLSVSTDEPSYMAYSYELSFSEKTSYRFHKWLIKILEERQGLLNRLYAPKRSKSQSLPKELSMKDVFFPGAIEEYKKVEESFIENDYISSEINGDLVWKKEPMDLIALICLLIEFGYIRHNIFQDYRTGCRRLFEKRYNFKLGQQFEKARVDKKTDLIQQYKHFPVYNDIRQL